MLGLQTGPTRAFLLTWLKKQGVTNLNDCGTDIRNVRKANVAFIQKARATLREDLVHGLDSGIKDLVYA